MIDIGDRLAPYVDLDSRPSRGVLQSVVVDVDAEVTAEPLSVAV